MQKYSIGDRVIVSGCAIGIITYIRGCSETYRVLLVNQYNTRTKLPVQILVQYYDLKPCTPAAIVLYGLPTAKFLHF